MIRKVMLIILLAGIGLSQAGCLAWLTGNTNEITTITYPDGTVTVVQTLSDDGMYQLQAGEIRRAKYAAVASCTTCTGVEIVAMILGIELGDDPIIKGMNGFEMTDSVLSNIAPYALAAWGVEKLADAKGDINMSGDNATYAPLENHITGSDGATANIPYRFNSPNPTITTTATGMP